MKAIFICIIAVVSSVIASIIFTSKNDFETNPVSVRLSISWLKQNIKEMLKDKNTVKVAVMAREAVENEPDIAEVVKGLHNFTHIIASVNKTGKVIKVILINDLGNGDPDVKNFLGNEGMVVINK